MGCVHSKQQQSAVGPDGKLRKEYDESLGHRPGKAKNFDDEEDLGQGNVLGLLKVAIPEGEMQDRGNYNIVVSMGLQSFRSSTTTSRSRKPAFEIDSNVAILRDSHVINIVVNRVKSQLGHVRSYAVGFASVDIQPLLYTPSGHNLEPKSGATHTSNTAPEAKSDVVFDAWIPLSDVGQASTVEVQKLQPGQLDGAAPRASSASDAEADEGETRSNASTAAVRMVASRTNVKELEAQFWRALVRLVDWDDSETLNQEEFDRLMRGVMDPDEISDEVIKAVWNDAVRGTEDGMVDAEKLAEVITRYRRGNAFRLMRRCPISGARLSSTDHQANILYMLLQMDGGTGSNLQGGFRTAAQARKRSCDACRVVELHCCDTPIAWPDREPHQCPSRLSREVPCSGRKANRTWIVQLSEWVTQPLAGHFSGLLRGTKYTPGLNTGANAAHIIVYNRARQALEEERISPVVVLAMRNMYQSSMGSLMKRSGLFSYLKSYSVDRGAKMDAPESVAEIAKFLKSYKGQISLSEIEKDISEFQSFNEFFYRKLKPGVRPIAHKADPTVVTSAADCRLVAFETIEDSKAFWIKGRNFTVAGLLANEEVAKLYSGASLVIFRLAPQDYHRFHTPVHAKIRSITEIPGELYTVNPIAVNSVLCDVMTENKRVRVDMESPEFGSVQFVAIGATLVGSITFTVQPGDVVAKGDELGYFAFGGSTCVVLFEAGRIVLDADLLRMSTKSIETYIKMGDHIGQAVDSTAHVSQTEVPESITVELPGLQQRNVSLNRSMTLSEVGAMKAECDAENSRLVNRMDGSRAIVDTSVYDPVVRDQAFLEGLQEDNSSYASD